ncbi:MAG TPA: anti-sigma factor [Dysgonomonas sp.]|nr:anti-sigma factor [Dysgonomonas sp.]
MQEYNIEEAVLLQYFEGTLDDDAKKAVEHWINDSEENAKIAKDIYYIYWASDVIDTIENVDAQSALEEVNKSIKKRSNRRLLHQVQKAAALLTLPLIAVALYFMMKQDPVEQIIVKSTPGMVAYFDLPDGTTVALNSGSELEYPDRFEGESRNIRLKGEAFFDVKKSDKRFLVNLYDKIQVEAYGTKFNVEAFEKNDFLAVSLVSGSVGVKYRDKNNNKEEIILDEGEKITYSRKNKSLDISSGTIAMDTAWKDGKIVLQNTPLDEVLKQLSKRFDAEFIVKNNKLKEERFTGTFETQHLYLILEHLRISSGIRYLMIEDKNESGKTKEKLKVELY